MPACWPAEHLMMPSPPLYVPLPPHRFVLPLQRARWIYSASSKRHHHQGPLWRRRPNVSASGGTTAEVIYSSMAA